MYYLGNQTFVTVPSGGTSNVGTIGLVPFGIVSGRILGSDPDHEPAAGVSVESVSRDGSANGGWVSTNAEGYFQAETPPLPSILSVVPVVPSKANPVGFYRGPYLSNGTFVDPAPDQVLNVGTLFLPRGTDLNLHLVDLTTHQTIPTPVYVTAQACVLTTGDCPFNPTNENGSVYALPGPARVWVRTPGYLDNSTVVAQVPPAVPGSEYNVTIDLVPDALVVFQTNVTGGIPPGYAPGGIDGDLQACSVSGLLDAWPNPNTPTSNASPQVISSVCTDTVGWAGFNVFTDFSPDQSAFVPPFRSWLHLRTEGGFVPLWLNLTLANTTPGEVLDIGTINYTPGGWVQGTVVEAGTPYAPPEGFQVDVCSTDQAGTCGGLADGGQGCGAGGANTSFCAPSPPGPVEIDVFPVGGPVNRTWAEVPYLCCSVGATVGYVDLPNITDPRIREINVTSVATAGTIQGVVMTRLADGTPIPVPLAAFYICPADPLAASGGCVDGTTNSSGDFSASVSTGWQSVQVSAEQMVSNETWIDVTGTNSSGVIWLNESTVLVGVAETPQGVAIPGATVQYCPVSFPDNCQRLGGGVTESGGLFYGTVDPEPFPGDALSVDVSESGYQDGSAWVNASHAGVINIGNEVLVPAGSDPGASPTGPHSTNTASTWLDGIIVDNSTGNVLSQYNVTVCDLLTYGCTTIPATSIIPNGGGFNDSFASTPVSIEIDQVGFTSVFLYENLSGAVVHLGVVDMDPLPRLTGRIALGPWNNLTFQYGVGPNDASVQLCAYGGYACGPSMFLDSGGFFNVGGPAGVDQLFVRPTNVSTTGFLLNPIASLGPCLTSVTVNVTVAANGSELNEGPTGAPRLVLYSVLTGRIGDASTLRVPGHPAVDPVRFGIVGATSSGPIPYASVVNVTPDGRYILIVPSGQKIDLTAGATSFWRISASAVAPLDSQTGSAQEIDLPHYGWVTTRVVDAQTHEGLASAGVSAEVADPANHTIVRSQGEADDSGYINLSAPIGSSVLLQDLVTGYTSTNVTVTVSESQTTPANLPPLTETANEIWVASREVNTVGVPPIVTVRDNRTGVPIEGAAAIIANDFGLPVVPSVSTNALGQFLIASPYLADADFAVEKPDYTTFATALPQAGGATRLDWVNLTGDGVVAGQLVQGGSNIPVEGVTVSACVSNFPPVCRSVTTNYSGEFWLGMPGGTVFLSFQADHYVGNQSYTVSLCQECFDDIGALPLWRESVIEGQVVSSPNGTALVGAQVTLCPQGFEYYAYCPVPIPTDALGAFYLEAVPSSGLGNYYLNVTDPGFEPLAISVTTVPGEVVNLGALTLIPNGTIMGVVLSGLNGTPLEGVSVLACPVEGGSGCSNTTTDATGAYSLGVSEDAYEITAGASGYFVTSETVTVLPGATTQAPPLRLLFDGPGQLFSVTGRVLMSADGVTPVPGAVVSVLQGGVAVNRTGVDTLGRFSVEVPWGTYSVQVWAAGFLARTVPLQVAGPTTPLTILLVAFAWNVTGTVRNTFDNATIPQAAILLGNTTVATADDAGRFSMALANGSYRLRVEARSAEPGMYQVATAPLQVSGVAIDTTLYVPLSLEQVALAAISATSGAALAGAQFDLNGALAIQQPFASSPRAGANGWATVALPPGSYTVSAIIPGYAGQNVSFQVTNGSLAVNVTVQPSGVPPAAGGPSLETLGGAALLAADVVAAIAVVARYWVTKRHRSVAVG
jgi:hypothetical protein